MNELKTAGRLFLLLTFLTGLAYPLAATGLASLLFPRQAAGSPVPFTGADGASRVVGSELLGQEFRAPGYFWGRPSATPGRGYRAELSAGSNFAASNPALAEAAAARAAALRQSDPLETLPIPADLVTASASGLDPHISLEAARWQARRVAAARGLPRKEVDNLIDSLAQRRVLAFLGEPRVNVLQLNLALDTFATRPPAAAKAP